MLYKHLKYKNTEYRAEYWEEIEALATGGIAVTDNEKLLKRLLPQMPGEPRDQYHIRLSKAYYEPLMGQAIERFTAGLATDPVIITPGDTSDSFYGDLAKDCSPKGGPRVALWDFLLEQAHTALLCGVAWTLVDFPAFETAPQNLAEEEASGARDGYLLAVDPCDVFDWEKDSAGALEWVVVRTWDRRRSGPGEMANPIEIFTVYSRDGWTRYAFPWVEGKAPADETPALTIEEGNHSFGQVPLIEMRLSDGLWAANKVFGLAVEIFRKSNAFAVGIEKGLSQVAVAYLSTPKVEANGLGDGLDPIKEDTNRAARVSATPGSLNVLHADDRLEFVAPSPEPWKVGQDNLKSLKESLDRTLDQMAFSVPNSGAALGRSAESKSLDMGMFCAVLQALGGYLREHAIAVFEALAKGRGDEVQFTASGADDFLSVSLGSLVNEAQTVELLSIPSPTFKAEYALELAKRLLPNATPEQIEAIATELRNGFSAEELISKMNEPKGGFGSF